MSLSVTTAGVRPKEIGARAGTLTVQPPPGVARSRRPAQPQPLNGYLARHGPEDLADRAADDALSAVGGEVRLEVPAERPQEAELLS
jgi:hypothetical protein